MNPTFTVFALLVIDLRAPALRFFVMTVPHRNNVVVIADRSPDKHHHAAAQITGGDVARLRIVEPVVNPVRGAACGRVRETPMPTTGYNAV